MTHFSAHSCFTSVSTYLILFSLFDDQKDACNIDDSNITQDACCVNLFYGVGRSELAELEFNLSQASHECLTYFCKFCLCFLGHCDMPLGLEDGRVPDQVMTASSYNNIYDAPWNARLNRRRYSRFGGGWSPRRNDGHRFLQVDFQALAKVTRVATQGMQNANYWVKKYYIKYSRTRTGFATYREGRTTKVCFIYLCDVKASSPDFAQILRRFEDALFKEITLRLPTD